jgi:transcription elongation factor Elf1
MHKFVKVYCPHCKQEKLCIANIKDILYYKMGYVTCENCDKLFKVVFIDENNAHVINEV